LFHLKKQHAGEIIAHAQAEAPNECCGLLAGPGGRVERVYRARNADLSPIRYSLAPKELLGYIKDIDDRDWDLLGIYHSHTHTQAYPSETDVRMAFWPDCLYVIVSLEKPREPYLRAFRILEGKIEEEDIIIE
jgi:proteasome lid subunit RPN8/RPN11